MGVSTVSIGGKSVIQVDCSKFGADVEGIINALREGSRIVASKPKKSVYIITNVTNLKFNSNVVTAFKEYASANTEYVKESVVVGLDGLQLVIFSTIKALTGRDYHLSATMEEAQAYMASAS